MIMGLIKNVFKVIGTAGLGIIGAGINSFANLEKKNGLDPSNEQEAAQKCFDTIKKMWGEEIDELPDDTATKISRQQTYISNLCVILENNRELRRRAIEAGCQEKSDEIGERIYKIKEDIINRQKLMIELASEDNSYDSDDMNSLYKQLDKFEREFSDSDN